MPGNIRLRVEVENTPAYGDTDKIFMLQANGLLLLWFSSFFLVSIIETVLMLIEIPRYIPSLLEGAKTFGTMTLAILTLSITTLCLRNNVTTLISQWAQRNIVNTALEGCNDSLIVKQCFLDKVKFITEVSNAIHRIITTI